jgi:serine protease Do
VKLTSNISIACLMAAWAAAASAADDLALREQQAFDAAAAAVAECVVQIHTAGGLAQVDNQALAQGPTTGLIVSADGYIVSSAFNFAQQPSSILVRLPDGRQRPAELIGRDTGRMLVLLKVTVVERLPTPEPAPLDEVHVGDWAIAAGRTFDAERLNVSVGVVSALNRMHGRVLQTDASASAANYGGPLVDLRGRVLGVIVAMAPQAPGATETNELAGAEFYDSGIAFAAPLEHVLAVLDRWIEERDLQRGLLGVGMTDGNPHATPPTVTAVWPRSPAAEAGWKPGDVIVAVDGMAVASQTELRFHVAPRYAGDSLEVTIRRGEGDETAKVDTTITLAAELEPYRHAFLGVLPQRDAEDSDDDAAEQSIVVRAVWPNSPAAQAGMQDGDRIVRLGDEDVDSIGDAVRALNAVGPGDELKVMARRGDELLELTLELAELPSNILSSAELPSADGAETETPEQPPAEPKLAELKLAEFPQTARYFAPPADGSPRGLLIWLGDGSEKGSEALAAAWQEACLRDRVVLVMPAPADEQGWSGDDLEYLRRLLAGAIGQFEVDPRRIVVGGAGKAGQLAYALAFSARKWVRGVAVVDSPLPRTLELPENSPNYRLAVLSVETRNAPMGLLIHRDLQSLSRAAFPATQVIRETDVEDGSVLDAAGRDAIARWMDGLDRF